RVNRSRDFTSLSCITKGARNAYTVNMPAIGNRTAFSNWHSPAILPNKPCPKSFRRLFGLQECVIFWMSHRSDNVTEIFDSGSVFFCTLAGRIRLRWYVKLALEQTTDFRLIVLRRPTRRRRTCLAGLSHAERFS